MSSATLTSDERAVILEAERRGLLGEAASKWRRALTRYRDNPLLFAQEAIDYPPEPDGRPGGLRPYQAVVLAELPARKRIAFYGPHGIGKTMLAAIVVLWGVLFADDAKIPTTASVWRQLSKFLWPEIRKWAKRLRWDVLGRPPWVDGEELMLESIRPRGTNTEAFALASDRAAAIEGAHARRIVFVYDEAKTIPAATFDATEGAFANAGAGTGYEAFALALSTPGETTGRFYEICDGKPGFEDWWVLHVTKDDAIAAGCMTQGWVDQRARQWGPDSPTFKKRVLGEFSYADAQEVVIPLEWIELANARHEEWQEAGRHLGPLDQLGVDVGRGGDPYVIVPRHGMVVPSIERQVIHDVMMIVDRLVVILRAGQAVAVIDLGYAPGVFDRCRRLGLRVQGHLGSLKSTRTDSTGHFRFPNRRCELLWNLRYYLDPGNALNVALPYDKLLSQDLSTPTWSEGAGGTLVVETKESVMEKLGRSPDTGDGVCMAFAPQDQELFAADEIDQAFVEGEDAWTLTGSS